jgi:hypothetical protein
VRNRFCTVCSGELLGKSQRLLSSSRPAQQSLIPTKLAAVLAAQRPANERWQQSLGGHSGDSGRISCSFPFASGAPAVVLHPTIRNGRCRPQPPSPLSNAAFKFRSGLSGPLLFSRFTRGLMMMICVRIGRRHSAFLLARVVSQVFFPRPLGPQSLFV